MAIHVKRKVKLGLETRDGDIYIVESLAGLFYLVAEAGTFHNPEVFPGMGSTEHIEVSRATFDALLKDIEMANSINNRKKL